MAYKAIRRVKKHPVDIIVGTKSRFEPGKGIPSVENEGYQRGYFCMTRETKEWYERAADISEDEVIGEIEPVKSMVSGE